MTAQEQGPSSAEQATATPKRIMLMSHADCNLLHWTLGEIRRCGNRFVGALEVTYHTFVEVERSGYFV